MAKARLRDAPLSDLQAEIERRQKDVQKLQSEWEKLVSRLAEVDQQLGELTGEAPSTAAPTTRKVSKKKSKKKRGKKKATKKKVAKKAATNGRRRRGGQPALVDMLEQVMSPDEPKRVGDLAVEVQRRGYKTKSADFAGQVSTALAQDSRFKKVARGQFVLAK